MMMMVPWRGGSLGEKTESSIRPRHEKSYLTQMQVSKFMMSFWRLVLLQQHQQGQTTPNLSLLTIKRRNDGH